MMLKSFIRCGSLTVIDHAGRRHAFRGTPTGPAGPAPEVTMRLTDRSLYHKLFLNPELHGGEAYMDGRMSFPGSSLRDFLILFSMNRQGLANSPSQRVLRPISRMLKRFQQANPVGRAQANVAHHYDIGNELYRLFLDAGMFYSCAYFRDPEESLEAAQINKCRLIAAKLRLRPGMSVLDIGSGWGGLAIYLARVADVRVLGVTLSREQHELACVRAAEAGVADRVSFELRDYRQIDQRFDRIVSVGMFEHVGVAHYDEFFRKADAMLAEDGVMLLHSIGKMSPPSTTSPWLRKYIFPGGYAPALSEVLPSTERNRLWVTDLEFLRVHYAYTLAHWQQRFEANRAAIAAMYDETFCRMFEFYLVSAEQVFRTGGQQVFHMQLARRRDAVPLTRDYIAEEHAALLTRERAMGLAGV
jgi:cyclopropane-fatty-acyl-phospholipid synthase